MNNRKPIITTLALLAVLLLSACATTSAVSPEDVIEQRAQARWDALLTGDYASAYAFCSPGYRSTVSATDYEIGIRLKRVKWTSASYLDHDCEENTCKVRFQMGYRVNSPVPGVEVWNGYDRIEDQWIKTGGEWWYLPPGE